MIQILFVLHRILLFFAVCSFLYIIRDIIFRYGEAILKTENKGEVLIANITNIIGTGKFKIKDWNLPAGNKTVGEVQVYPGRAIVRIIQEDINGDVYFKDIGDIDASGTIYTTDSSGNRIQVGSCDPKGKRSWRQLWLVNHTLVKDAAGNEIGRCTERIRLGKHKSGITLLARAAAVLLLYDPSESNEYIEKRSLATIKLSQVALFGSLIYATLYFIFERFFSWHVTFPWLGQDFSFLASMMLFYVGLLTLIWFVMRDMSRSYSYSFKWLNLINRNTGIKGWNTFLIFSLIGACFTCYFFNYFSLFPFYLSLLIGVSLNLFSTSAPWKIIYPSDNYIHIPSLSTPRLSNIASRDPYPGIPVTALVTNNYYWSFFSNIKGKEIVASLPLQFNKKHVDEKRKENPFWGAKNDEAIKDLYKSAQQIIAMSSDVNDDEESKWALDLILKKISEVARKENLSHYETMQLMLSFCQTPNFTWVLDHECEEINPNNRPAPYDYFRFPIETLYDKRGDGDCTAMLVYRLFNRAGIKAKYLLMKKGDVKHVAVAIEKKDNIPIDDENLITIHGEKFYFCEAVGSRWHVGILPDGYKEIAREFEDEIIRHPERVLG
jgi:hypothetical protein